MYSSRGHHTFFFCRFFSIVLTQLNVLCHMTGTLKFCYLVATTFTYIESLININRGADVWAIWEMIQTITVTIAVKQRELEYSVGKGWGTTSLGILLYITVHFPLSPPNLNF